MTAEVIQEVLQAVAAAVRSRKERSQYPWAKPDRAMVADVESTVLYRLGMDVEILNAAARQYDEDFPDGES